MKKINKNNTIPLTPFVRGEQNSHFPLISGIKGVISPRPVFSWKTVKSIFQNSTKNQVKTGLKGKWFTLVELIIVITILAILATIAFVSFGNYNKSSRDANRVATLKSIEKWLSLVEVKNWKYPTPDEYITISSWTTIYINQWIVWQTVSQNILLNKESKDPKDNTNYQYSTNWNNTKYQLWTYLEEDNKTLLSLIPQTYASSIDYTNRYFYTIWDKVWIFLSGATNKPLLKTGSLTWVDLSSDNTEYKIYFSNNTNSWSITWSWSDLVDEIVENQESSWTTSNNQSQIENCNWKSIWQPCAWWIYAWELNWQKYMTTPGWCTDSSTPTCTWWTDTLTKVWNYWNGNWTTTSITSTTDWLWNTTALATTKDADSTTTWTQPHLAAKYCYDMVYWWYDDWFLPAKDELNLLYINRTNIWGFDTNYYWSSTENYNTSAWSQRFSDGDQLLNAKSNSLYVRCIRKF